MPPTDHSKPEMSQTAANTVTNPTKGATGEIRCSKARRNTPRPVAEFGEMCDLRLKIERLHNAKPKGLRGLIHSTKLGSARQQSKFGKEKSLSKLVVTETLTCFRRRSPKHAEKEYKNLHLKHMINLYYTKSAEGLATIEIYSNLGEVWSITTSESYGKTIHDEIKTQFNVIKEGHRYTKDLEFFTEAFIGNIQEVRDCNKDKGGERPVLTPGKKMILLSTTAKDSYQLELRDYNELDGSKVVINQDHAYSWSFMENKLHFMLKERAPLGRIDFLIYCSDGKKLSERIKPIIEKEVVKQVPITQADRAIRERLQNARRKREINAELRSNPPMSRSRSNYGHNSIEHSWKSSKSPQSVSMSPSDSGVTAGTPASGTEFSVK